KWAELGRTSSMGVSGAQGQFNFLDSSGAFTRSGAVSFDRPGDMVEAEVGGTKNYWIRARINSGNYGAPGSYELIGQNWVLEEDLVQKGPRVVWEHWDGARWADLLPQDCTYGFTRSGYLTFNGPRNFEKRSVFDSEAWWLRARLESGSYDLAPVLRAVLVNAVDAINGVTVEEVLGSSDGSLDQRVTL